MHAPMHDPMHDRPDPQTHPYPDIPRVAQDDQTITRLSPCVPGELELLWLCGVAVAASLLPLLEPAVDEVGTKGCGGRGRWRSEGSESSERRIGVLEESVRRPQRADDLINLRDHQKPRVRRKGHSIAADRCSCPCGTLARRGLPKTLFRPLRPLPTTPACKKRSHNCATHTPLNIFPEERPPARHSPDPLHQTTNSSDTHS